MYLVLLIFLADFFNTYGSYFQAFHCSSKGYKLILKMKFIALAYPYESRSWQCKNNTKQHETSKKIMRFGNIFIALHYIYYFSIIIVVCSCLFYPCSMDPRNIIIFINLLSYFLQVLVMSQESTLKVLIHRGPKDILFFSVSV